MSEAAAASSDLETAILFGFGGEEAVATAYRYTNLVLTGFAQAYLLNHPWDRMGDAGEGKVRGGVRRQSAEEKEK